MRNLPRIPSSRTTTPAPLANNPLAHLIRPRPDQMALHANDVTRRIELFDAHARRFGEALGLAWAFELNPFVVAPQEDQGLAVLRGMLRVPEFVHIERIDSRWGLYFRRTPAIFGNQGWIGPISLREAPLDARQRFLDVSEVFFRGYLEACQARLGGMQQAVQAADRTLSLLDQLQL